MKNRLYILITIILAAFICFSSCKSDLDKAGADKEETRKISISVKFPSLEKNALNARKAFLTEEEVENIINSYTFTLMAKRLESEGGEQSELEAKTVLSGFTYDELQKATFDIQAGPWLFTLYAYGQATGEICLSGTDTATITAKSVNLEFEMTYVKDVCGIFQFTVPISSYDEDVGATPGYYQKIVIRSFDSPDKDYLVYEYNNSDNRVSNSFKKDEASGKTYCTYSVKLGVGKYMVFVYNVKSSNPASGVQAYMPYPCNNGGEIVYIYGGVATSKEYLTSTDNAAQNVDVELYIGKNRAEELNATNNKCWGDFAGLKSDYEYNAELGCLTFKNTFTLEDFYLPKFCFADEYLLGWYTDKERTKKADCLRYIKCGGQTDRLSDVSYFIYDLTKVAGTLKLYAKFASRYDILIDTAGETLTYNGPLSSFGEELVEPEEGSNIWTLKNCAYEMPLGRFDIEKYNDDRKKYICLGWYYDQNFTKPASEPLNENFTGLDPEGNQIKLYPRLINPDAKMYLQIMNGKEDITNQIDEVYYSKEIDFKLDYDCIAYVAKYAIPDKDGYRFIGMYLDPDFETEVSLENYGGNNSYVYRFNSKDFVEDQYITFYAKYEKLITYTFKANNGEWNGGTTEKTAKGTFGSTVNTPEDPTRTGYEFTGWDNEVPETFGTENLTFTAQWEAIPISAGIEIELEQIVVDDEDILSIELYSEDTTGRTIIATIAEGYSPYLLNFAGNNIDTGKLIAENGTLVIPLAQYISEYGISKGTQYLSFTVVNEKQNYSSAEATVIIK